MLFDESIGPPRLKYYRGIFLTIQTSSFFFLFRMSCQDALLRWIGTPRQSETLSVRTITLTLTIP